MTRKISPPSSIADEDIDTRQMMRAVIKRLSGVALFSSVSALACALALFMLMPLKTSVPYVVQVNRNTGEVTIPGSTSVVYVPTWANESFFLRRWLQDLFTINRYLTVQIDDPRAQYFIRGENAIAEYNAFRAEDKTFARLAADPTLVRNVKILSLDPIASTKNGAVAQVQLTTIEQGRVIKQNLLVTLYFVILPPTTQSEMERDPIGIYVTDFKIAAASGG
jgi:type IV secretion system protein VirB5